MNPKCLVIAISILLVLTTPLLARAKNFPQTRDLAKATLRNRTSNLFSERVSCDTVVTVSGKFSKLCRRR
ncbi:MULTISPECIES: hypothetical protein [Spirulina sp. CCY15215]|uniref:hypothetical protein n=1 Tax=Spirulina sp. CCY15215 TaxID=2767591 RepID=UPI001950033B|nr:hypothetical protein [Spirulina major]